MRAKGSGWNWREWNSEVSHGWRDSRKLENVPGVGPEGTERRGDGRRGMRHPEGVGMMDEGKAEGGTEVTVPSPNGDLTTNPIR